MKKWIWIFEDNGKTKAIVCDTKKEILFNLVEEFIAEDNDVTSSDVLIQINDKKITYYEILKPPTTLTIEEVK